MTRNGAVAGRAPPKIKAEFGPSRNVQTEGRTTQARYKRSVDKTGARAVRLKIAVCVCDTLIYRPFFFTLCHMAKFVTKNTQGGVTQWTRTRYAHKSIESLTQSTVRATHMLTKVS